jgi:hypothetical protein
MNEPVVVRASTLSGWPDCPRRGAARLLWREVAEAGFELRRTPRGIGAAVGSAVHAAAEITLREKAKTGALPPASFAIEVADASLIEQLAEGETLFDQMTPNRSDALHQAIGMARAYHRQVAPQVEPIIVEERLEADIAPGLVLSGQADVVAREPETVRDLKSGVRPQPRPAAPQLGSYSLLARSNGLDIKKLAIDYLQRVSIRKPQPAATVALVAIAAAETAATSILKHIAGDLKTFREGDRERRLLPGDPWAFMANPASILCGPKYCPAYATEFCHEGGAAKEVE